LAAYYPQLVDAARAMPGVSFVGAADQLPLIGGGTSTLAKTDDGPVMVDRSIVIPDYFEAMGIPLQSGRLPGRTDGARPVAVLSDAAAKTLFPHRSPVGGHVLIDRQDCEVLGVVGNVRHWGAAARGGMFDRPKIYVLFGQSKPTPLSL